MSAACRGPDLSFLSEDEARTIFQVLQRDSELRRAEKDRVRKLLERKKSETGLQGVTGEWFEEIQRKKFQNNTDVNTMLKPPLEHQLRNSKKTNHKEFKMSSHTNPQAQKNTSASFLGFRSPFAWLFSFRKSRKKQIQKQPRYDNSASTAPKVEEMAMAEMCNSLMSTDATGHSFDVKQDEMMEKSTQEWNEQLEKEFFSVLSDLDDQLAQEQSQDLLDRPVSTSSASNVQYNRGAFPTSKRQTASRGQHRNDWSDMPSTFFPDGLRTIRARDEHKIFIRPRKLHSAYMNWQQTFQDDYKYGDPVDGNPHLLSSGLSTVSFGRSSEGSLYPPSVTQNSGFRHKSYMNRDTAGRSYSVCSLRRCPSSVSSEQLSASGLQHPLARESNNGFVPRFGRQNPKRIPLSSIVWNNAPDSPGQTSAQEKMFRTQSLMEFHATDHGRYPSSLQENKKYTCYHSKHQYRRSISSSNCFSRVSCPDRATSPLSFDNWENYPLYQSENNLSRSYHRDNSHSKLYANQKNSYGRRDSYPWTDFPQYHSDDVFLSPDASFEVIMANLNDQQWTHTRNAKFSSQHLQNDFHMCSPENTNYKTITRSASRTFSEFTEGCQPWLSCNSSVSSAIIRSDESVLPNLKDQTKPIGLKRNSVIVTQRSTKADFTQLENVEGMKLPDEVDVQDMPLRSVSQQADTSYINAQSFPSNNSAFAMLQGDASLINSLRSKRLTQASARTDTAKMDASNGDKRNVQMKENDRPLNSVFSQHPCLLPADESRKEPFLPSQKEWKHNLHYMRKREGIKQDNRCAEAVNHAPPKGFSSLLNVASAPSTEKLENCQGTSWPPDCSSSSSPSFPQALSHKDNSKCLGTLTNSSASCTVTESHAGGEQTAQVSRIGVTKKISQQTPQSTSTLVTKDYSGQFNASSPQHRSSGSIYTHGDPETSEHSLNYFCLEKESGKIRNDSFGTEKLHKQDSLLRHTSSCSITGSPSRSNFKSSDPLVIYYTLPRKSASIAGSIMSDTPISFTRENRRSTYDCLRSEIPSGADAFCSSQRDVSCLESKRSFLTSAPLNAATSNRDRDYPNPLTRSPNDSVSGSTSVELSDRCRHLSRRESSVFSDCKEGGNGLQKYKTTSTFTVCVDEDHVKYHELVSIYYTLPRRHSKAFCNLFRDNAEDADLPLSDDNSQTPRIRSKKNEGHVSLANVFFPSTLEKEVPCYSSDQVSSALVTPQNLETAVNSKEENSHFPPGSERVCTAKSVSTVNNRKGSSADLSVTGSILPDVVTKDISFGGPQPIAIAANSGKALSDASNNQSTKTRLKEKDIPPTAAPLTSTLSTPPKPDRLLDNSFYSTSTNKNGVQKGSSANCYQPATVSTNKNRNSLLLHTREKSSRGRISNTERADGPLPPREDTDRDSTKVKQGINLLHRTTPLYNNKCSGLQLRADTSTSNANDLNSSSKMLSESQNKAFEVSTTSSADRSLQLDKTISTDKDELKNSKIKKEQNSESTQVGKDCSGLQESEKPSEGSVNVNSKDKVSGASQDQKLTQSAENESKLLSDCTRDKVKDIEKRKNRASIKNKLAAVCKTSRKFSSKNLPPKPHISNIFSQNDGNAVSLEASMSPDSLVSADCHQSSPQSENENQNHSPDPDRNTQIQKTAENSKSENVNDPSSLVNNLNWKSFASLYAQKEAISPKKTTMKVENRPNLSTLFTDKAVATRNKNAQTLDLGLENRSQPTSLSATTPDPVVGEKKRATSSACSPPLPLLTDKNSNTFVNNCLQTDICPKQNLTSQTALGEHQNTAQYNSLKNANLQSYLVCKNRAKNQRERHLSEGICAQDSCETFASGSDILPKDSIHGKRFKSSSELLSCDENENWASDDEKCYSTRNLMYPSVEFGIFGKEQQLAFLENIKRSLTEGRLWRPCLLNNPGALRDGETPSINRAALFSSSSAGSKISSAASSPRELTDIYQEDPATYSDSDSDTTTDDEYYLDEIDKESEL
ncbi:exophilin-5 isoform X2 [Aythya fuligula]|uniref:Exophilin-5 isoform X2 n=1 Tax=Aythya fuligula TaxID=219594 RepID=A0A6J3E8M0_AYTFU|nr:exophilin-5 isoform X2 [Aythya fuligula]